MAKKLSIGIASPANLRAGVQRVIAMAAVDLARSGHSVAVFVPIFPWYYYFVTLSKHPARWLRYVLPHVGSWAKNRRFSFQELLDGEGSGGRIRVKFVSRRASARHLAGLDFLILYTIAQVVEYQDRFPQERQIYVLPHPEEQSHGHADLFRTLRTSFRGKILAMSPLTAREISDHVPNSPVSPVPVSPLFWKQRHSFDPRGSRKDVLFQWKDNAYGQQGMEVINALREIRPNTTIAVWCAGLGTISGAKRALPGVSILGNLSEQQLCDLYLGHSFLLFPSTQEGFGLPPVEGLACGCIPVLHPEVGAAELYARDGENSIYLGGNPRDVAQRIAEVLDSPDTLCSMRIAGAESVAPFDPNGYGLRLLQAAGVS